MIFDVTLDPHNIFIISFNEYEILPFIPKTLLDHLHLNINNKICPDVFYR